MNAFIAIIKKELRAVKKERTIMIAIGIQLFIASFSSVILVGLLSFYDPSSISLNSQANIKVGILGDIDSPLVGYLKESNVRPVFLSFPEDAERAFELGTIDAILSIPESSNELVNVQLFLPEAETRATVVMMILREPLKQFENHIRAERGIVVNYQDIQGKSPTTFEFLYSTIIPILMFFPGFVAGSMVVDSISSELEHNTFDTLRSVAVSLNQILGAKIAASLILAVVQAFLWIILVQFNQIELSNIGLVFLLAATVAGLNGIGAAIITLLFKDRERAQFVYSIAILFTIGVSYSRGSSPFTLMTQLASGDYYASFANVASYGILLMVLSIFFFSLSKRLLVAKL